MFGVSRSNCGVAALWHRIVLALVLLWNQCTMFLGRSESLKWIRRKFSKRNNSNPTAPLEHTPAKISKTNNVPCENIRDLNEILVISNTSAPACANEVMLRPETSASISSTSPSSSSSSPSPSPSPSSPAAATSSWPSSSSSPCPAPSQTAPIAREEDAGEMEEEPSASGDMAGAQASWPNDAKLQSGQSESERAGVQHDEGAELNENVVRRSKSSRVRNYLRKCKDRWLAAAGNGHNAEHNPHLEHDPAIAAAAAIAAPAIAATAATATASLAPATKSNVSQHPQRPPEITDSSVHDALTAAQTPGDDDARSLAGGMNERAQRHAQPQPQSQTQRPLRDGYSNCALGSVREIEDDEADDADAADESYEDIDFGLRGCRLDAVRATATPRENGQPQFGQENAMESEAAAAAAEGEQCSAMRRRPQMHAEDVEYQIAALIDHHLERVYPVYGATTRAVLIREARDVLVKTYHGCLSTFRRRFLCKFTEIAAVLSERHRLGEALIWCQGWPLVTPNGEVILHLGDLDDEQLKPAELYLCVKTADPQQPPQLHATWRTPNLAVAADHQRSSSSSTTPLSSVANTLGSTSAGGGGGGGGAALRHCQFDYTDNTLYLSALTLEMLNEDLPQLLQSLLIGVEHNLERLSLNQLPHLAATAAANHEAGNRPVTDTTATLPPTAATAAIASASASANYNSIVSRQMHQHQQHHHQHQQQQLQLMKTQTPNSPKCVLRRSELITKNKLHTGKYMLRRFTNRQDSMNSTSSGNSSASGLSTASSHSSNSSSYGSGGGSGGAATKAINGHEQNGNANGSGSGTGTGNNETIPNDCNTSPALPRFCLGTSFPHIDSDEENAEERRHSLTDDQLESEIVAPNLITDLPEKLLISGIYLPGTRDVRGNPLVTVDAEAVLAAGLNCYEIATLLLYYSTIPERSISHNNNNSSLANAELSASPQRSSQRAAAPAAAATAAAAHATAAQAMPSASSGVTAAAAKCSSFSDGDQQQQQQQQQSPSEQRQQQQPQEQQQQQAQQSPQSRVTFTLLIAVEKSQHLCVIDLISQSLKLLTRHIAYCHLVVVCIDASLMQSIKFEAVTAADAAAPSDEANATAVTPAADKSSMTQMTPTTPTTTPLDSNGNWRCHKKSESHAITYLSLDEVTTSGGSGGGGGGVATAAVVPSGRLGGLHHHDARKWREFFVHYEPFYQQCSSAAQRLVAALNDIRQADLQGLPTRRQLYAQHRALSRALMDSELHNLRKRSVATMARLQELARSINCPGAGSGGGAGGGGIGNKTNGYCSLKGKSSNIGVSYTGHTINRHKILGSGAGSSYSFNYQGSQNHKSTSSSSNNNNNTSNNSSCSNTTHLISHNMPATATTALTGIKNPTPAASPPSATASNSLIKSSAYSATASAASRLSPAANAISPGLHYTGGGSATTPASNMDVAIKLQKVSLLYNEIDRAAKRLEQLTEQRREHLRELTRQQALEDEINEVTSWITNDGSESLQRFINMELDWDTPMREREQEFEKYYFISMKNLAKGRDLNAAAANMESLKESAIHLRNALDAFAEKLEIARERIEGASRLHQLLNSQERDNAGQQEIERLAELYGAKGLLQKYRDKEANSIEGFRRKPDTLALNLKTNYGLKQSATTATATTPTALQMITSSTPDSQKMRSISCPRSNYGTASYEGSSACHCWRDSRNLDDIEDDIMDNDEEEGQSKVADSGVGECQHCEGNPKLMRICSCQSLNEDAEIMYKKHDELDDECFEQPSKCYLNVHSPLEANKHLQCFASTFELPKLEELSCLDPKIQKTLLLIMREMIGTERDYVRSLYYVIENYIDELLRDDIPQSLRGQRNVIFGNIEKIFEFHNNHFLTELERYENNPLKVGAAFLQMESKFYLYALYNKNKPKSDTLMSEYGTAFFKSKQLELNDKMDLASYLLKPVQRMGKYALLLQQLVKACSSVQGAALQEIAADVEELQKAEEMVKFQLRHGNDLLAMDSLRDCDVNVKEQGRLLRQNEFLVWQGKCGKKTLRHIFLFEELVLFSKARRFPDHKNLDIYIYKNSIKTSDIGLTAHIGDSPTKFEIWFRKRKPEDTWTLQCMSEDIKNTWTEEISKLLWQQAKKNREIRLAEMSSMGIGSKPCLDIRPSNNQINDRSITISQLGKAPKLRHSFVGLHSEQMKASRRPNSLISESSLSSGTSSSSLSKSSTSSSASSAHLAANQTHGNGLELITESQALSLDQHPNENGNSKGGHNNQPLSSSSNGGGGTITARTHRNYHKRSTTIVSQLSMESGIISDICMTPDQDNNDLITTWPSHHTPTDVVAPAPMDVVNHNTLGKKFLHKYHSNATAAATMGGKKCGGGDGHHSRHRMMAKHGNEEMLPHMEQHAQQQQPQPHHHHQHQHHHQQQQHC